MLSSNFLKCSPSEGGILKEILKVDFLFVSSLRKVNSKKSIALFIVMCLFFVFFIPIYFWKVFEVSSVCIIWSFGLLCEKPNLAA